MGLLDFTDEFLEVFERWDGTVGAPSPENRKTQRVRVYKNAFVENVLATSHPILPGVWFGGFIVYGLYAAVVGEQGPVLGLGVYFLGVLAFTLIEYLLHRFPFHYQGDGSRSARLRLFLMHGYHHEFPNDPWRLVAPPIMSWPVALVVGFAYWLMFGFGDWWFIVFGGTCAGYLYYDWAHYYTHHARNPRTWFGKTIRRAHAVHHYKLHDLNMGISSPLWDLVFGTFGWSTAAQKEAMQQLKDVERSTG